MTKTQGSEPAEVYALGFDSGESARLTRQSEELRPEAEALLTRIGLRPGQAAMDLGCGPAGILELLAAAVAPAGRVVGLDANPAHIEMAEAGARESGLAGVELIAGDARRTGLPSGSFDLVHARTLLVTVPNPAEVLAEMVRLTKPGGWVASQEPDCEHAVCYPPLPAWDRMRELFFGSFGRSGADPCVGRRLAGMYADARLSDIGVAVHAGAYTVGHSRRSVMPDLVRSLRPAIIDLGLAGQRELIELDREVRQHLADPRTVMMPHLLFSVWGRKPGPS